MTAPELSADERARVAAFGIHDAEAVTPAAVAREHGWKAGTRLHGGPVIIGGLKSGGRVDVMITAIGLELVLAIPASGEGAERSITFDARDWVEVTA